MSNRWLSLKKHASLLIIHLLNMLPIKKNKIFLFSYYGSQYGDNPKYISEYIMAHFPKDKFDVVWAFNDIDSNQHLTDFKKVKSMSLKYFYHLSTSKVIITNYRTTDWFVKRKKQFYIQTWHSSLRLKHIEKDAQDVLPEHYVQMAQKDSVKCDLLLSGCKLSTEIFRRAFWYDGEILECGTPRNDLFFHQAFSQREEILSKLNIPNHSSVLLYAPTFRKDNNLEIYKLDYSNILESLKSRFGGEWVFLVRLHPHLISISNELPLSDQIRNVTSYDDIQQLLRVTDVLISDYSSLMFDYAYTGRPCFLYVPDLDQYSRNERNLYFDIDDLPFISASSNRDLQHEIESFHEEQYQSSVNEFLNEIGSFEKGNACEIVLNRINDICFEKRRRRAYEAV